MAVTVEILYDDLTIVTNPIEQLDTLVKTGILIMLFKKDGFNIISLMGLDHYHVSFVNDVLSYVQYDDEDGAIHNHDLIAGTIETQRTFRDMGWIPANYVHFAGKSVSTDKWNQALEIFNNQMTNPVV